MNAEEMIIKYAVSNGTTTDTLKDSDVIVLMKEYAKQQVIGVLEGHCNYLRKDGGVTTRGEIIGAMQYEIKKLKQ